MPMTLRHALSQIMRSLPGPAGGEARDQAREALRDAQLFATSLNHKGWPHNQRQGHGRNAGGYDTGTVTFTKNGRTVTGSGTTWTEAMVGWRIGSAASREEVYEIVAVGSTTSLTLARPYEGETNSGTAYRMYDPYATMPADLQKFISVQFEYGPGIVGYINVAKLKADAPKPILFSDGNEALFAFAQPTNAARYSTGTVTITAGSPTVTLATGTWPEWLVGRHIRFQNEDVLYKILSRTSDAVLVLDRVYGGDWPGAGLTYELDPAGAQRIQLHHPHEAQFAFTVEYFCTPQALVNDGDVLEGGDEYGRAIVNMAKAEVLARAVPATGLTQEQMFAWKTKADSYRGAGERQLQALIEGNKAPEDQAVMGLYFR